MRPVVMCPQTRKLGVEDRTVTGKLQLQPVRHHWGGEEGAGARGGILAGFGHRPEREREERKDPKTTPRFPG